jgi:hypothetical protein
MERRRFLQAVGATTAVAVVGNTRDVAAAPPPGATAFTSLTPTRLCDTRNGVPQTGVTRLDANTIRVQVTGRGGVTDDTVAVAVGLAAVRSTGGGFIAAYPGGSIRPTVANLNVTGPSQTVQSMAVVRLGTGGTIDVHVSKYCDVVVDLLGAFGPVTNNVAAGRYVPISQPFRVLDTRPTGPVAPGGSVAFNTTGLVPADASAAVVAMTCAGSSGGGYFVCHQDGTAPPFISHMNCDSAWQVRSSQAIVPVGPGTRWLRITSSGGGHLVAEIVGYITGPSSPLGSDGLFVPAAAPSRQIDTRQINGLGWMPENWSVEVQVPAGVVGQAAVWNIAVAQASNPGFITLFPARTPRPPISQLHAQFNGQTANSHTWSRISPFGSSMFSAAGGALIADFAGHFVGAPAAATTGPLVNVSPVAYPPYTLEVPALGLSMPVTTGGSSIVDYGYGWIMPGSTNVGENGYVVVFAHRTDAGGPFRYIHYLGAGDEMYLVDGTGKRWLYRVTNENITGSASTSIMNAVGYATPPALSLVACSRADGTPTSLSYRLVVSGGRQFTVVP